jgi:hypothetical protein
MSKTAFLKEKTDAECRQLAAHYWHRANKAEKERDQIKSQMHQMHLENQRLIGLAHDMIGASE